MKLREIAHSRSGDKGNTANISIIAFRPGGYALLKRAVTVDVIRGRLAGLVIGEIERYEVPSIGALNFVLHGALGGGVTRSLALDAHGKCLSSAVLDIEIEDSEITF